MPTVPIDSSKYIILYFKTHSISYPEYVIDHHTSGSTENIVISPFVAYNEYRCSVLFVLSMGYD